ncbi:MAG: hypothetical protein IJG34_00850 [Synergistaceae bacterium]|nr:hypothetical protein [Synergistaceae bacterium]
MSLDDVIQIFRDITIHENDYVSIFENDTLRFLKKLHDKFGTVISCYCFFRSGDFALSQCTDKFRDEFMKNSDWLKFGFHAFDPETTYGNEYTGSIRDDYDSVIENLISITGDTCIDSVIRLHYFAGSLSEIKSLTSSPLCPLRGLLCADDRRPSYYLNEAQNEYIYSHDYFRDDINGIDFYATDLRAEFIKSVSKKISEFKSSSWNNQLGILTLFSHEWALNPKTKCVIESLCEYAKNNNYVFTFLNA